MSYDTYTCPSCKKLQFQYPQWVVQSLHHDQAMLGSTQCLRVGWYKMKSLPDTCESCYKEFFTVPKFILLQPYAVTF